MYRFLLGQYKAALDAYVEVESLQPNDWVGVVIPSY